MAIKIPAKWWNKVPGFSIYMSFPLVKTEVQVFEDTQHFKSRTYLGYRLHVWRWSFDFRLYQLGGTTFVPPTGEDLDVEELGCGCFISNRWKIRKYCDDHFNIIKKHHDNGHNNN
jgi:hypothetical protein